MNKALITGSSKGIGLAIAKKLLQDSWTVVGCARTWPEPMEGTFIPYTLDLANLDTLPDHLTVLQKLHADLSLLICNVGKGLFGSVEEFSYTQMRSLIDLNFLSNAYFVKAFIPLFKQRRHGHVIFIGSESALQGKRMGSLYSASKFALRGFAQALHEECASSHIRVTTIHPGWFKHLSLIAYLFVLEIMILNTSKQKTLPLL